MTINVHQAIYVPYLSRWWLRLLGKLKGNVSRNLTHGWEIVTYRHNPLPPWPLAVKSFSYFVFLGLVGTQRLVLNFNVMVSSVNLLSYTSSILWIKAILWFQETVCSTRHTGHPVWDSSFSLDFTQLWWGLKVSLGNLPPYFPSPDSF